MGKVYSKKYGLGFVRKFAEVRVEVPEFLGKKPEIEVKISSSREKIAEEVVKEYERFAAMTREEIKYLEVENVNPKEVVRSIERIEAIWESVEKGIVGAYRKILKREPEARYVRVSVNSDYPELGELIKRRIRNRRTGSRMTPFTKPGGGGKISRIGAYLSYLASAYFGLKITQLQELPLENVDFWRYVVTPALVGTVLYVNWKRKKREAEEKNVDYVFGRIARVK